MAQSTSSASASEVVNASLPLHKINGHKNHEVIDGLSGLHSRDNSTTSLSIQDYSSSSISEDNNSKSNNHRPLLVQRRSYQSFDSRGSGESSIVHSRHIDDKGGTAPRRASPPRHVSAVGNGGLLPPPTTLSSSQPAQSSSSQQQLPPLPYGRSSTPPPSITNKHYVSRSRSRSQSRLYSSGNHIITHNSYSSPIHSPKVSSIPSPIQSPKISAISPIMSSMPSLWASNTSSQKQNQIPTQQQWQIGGDDGESSVSSDCSTTSLERLEKLSKQIRSQIRAAEMAALAEEAEEAAELGRERFSAHPSTYGHDSDDDDADKNDDMSRGSARSLPPHATTTTAAAVLPFKLVRTSTVDNSSTRSSFRSLTKIRSRLLNQDVTPQVKVSKLRNITEVVPKFNKLHGHLKTHMVLGGVDEHSLLIDPPPPQPSPKFEDIVRASKSIGSKAPSVTSSVGQTVELLKNLTLFRKKTTVTTQPSSSLMDEPESPRKKLRLESMGDVIESPIRTQTSSEQFCSVNSVGGLSPNSIVAKDSYDYSDDDDDESVDSSRMGSILADHIFKEPRRGKHRKASSPLKIPSGLHIPDIEYAAMNEQYEAPASPSFENRDSPTRLVSDPREQQQKQHQDDKPMEVVTTPVSSKVSESLHRNIEDFSLSNPISLESKKLLIPNSESGGGDDGNGEVTFTKTLTWESDDVDTQDNGGIYSHIESPHAPSGGLEFDTPCRLRGIRGDSKGDLVAIKPKISMPDLNSSRKSSSRKRPTPHQTLKQRTTFESDLRPSLYLSAVDLDKGGNEVKIPNIIEQGDSTTSGETTQSSSKPETSQIEEVNSMSESERGETQDGIDKDLSKDNSSNKVENNNENFTPVDTLQEEHIEQGTSKENDVDMKNDTKLTCEEEKKCEEDSILSEEVDQSQLESKDEQEDMGGADKQASDEAPLNKLEPTMMKVHHPYDSDAEDIVENMNSGDTIEQSNSCAECLLCDVPQIAQQIDDSGKNDGGENETTLRRSSSLPDLSVQSDQESKQPKEDEYESKTDIGVPSFQTPRSSNSVLTAMNIFKQSISPHSSSSPSKPNTKDDSFRNRAITPRENNAFLQNYLYCSKRNEKDHEENLPISPHHHPFCEPVAVACADVVLCGGYKADYYDDTSQKKKTEPRKLDLDGHTSPTSEPEAWFDTAVDKFDDMLSNVIGDGDGHKSRWTLDNFYSPKLKFKKDRKRNSPMAKFDAIEEQSRLLSAQQFHMLYGITREEYFALPKVERAKVKGKRAVLISRGGFPIEN